MRRLAYGGVALCIVAAICSSCDTKRKMSFFVTSVPAGDGGSMGGLDGADAHCQRLAMSAGSSRH